MSDISLLALFGIFFYVGLFTIGGGLVAITLMQQMIVERGLISSEKFFNMVAVSESTPGPIGVNMATYLGYEFYGIPGALVTTFGEILPSIIVILIIARFLQAFKEKRIVQSIFICIRPAATGLIFVATFHIFCIALLNLPENLSELKEASAWLHLVNWKSLVLYIPSLFLAFWKKSHPVILILLGAIFGIFFL